MIQDMTVFDLQDSEYQWPLSRGGRAEDWSETQSTGSEEDGSDPNREDNVQQTDSEDRYL